MEMLLRQRDLEHFFVDAPRCLETLPFRCLPADVFKKKLCCKTRRVIATSERNFEGVFLRFRGGSHRNASCCLVPENYYRPNAASLEYSTRRSVEGHTASRGYG